MKRMFFSLTSMLLIGGVAIGATAAQFTSHATQANNTFATGQLLIKMNGSSTIPGFTLVGASPGDCQTGQFVVQNFGAPVFAGTSTVAANHLTISSIKGSGDNELYNQLAVKVESNRGEPTNMLAYNGKLKNLNSADLLTNRWSDLKVGETEDVFYQVCLPVDAPSSAHGSSSFDFVVDASS